jgi:hypothetical protein
MLSALIRFVNSYHQKVYLEIDSLIKAKQLEDEVASVSKVVKELKTTKASKDSIKKAEDEYEQLKAILEIVREAVCCNFITLWLSQGY